MVIFFFSLFHSYYLPLILKTHKSENTSGHKAHIKNSYFKPLVTYLKIRIIFQKWKPIEQTKPTGIFMKLIITNISITVKYKT